jgi:hypothetical protein
MMIHFIAPPFFFLGAGAPSSVSLIGQFPLG